MSDYIRQHAVSIDYKKDENWTILSEIEQSIKKKIEAVGIPLKDWDIKINRGILTGLNEAFIISKEKRDELIAQDPKSAEIIRPILRGRDIKRYSYEFAELYIITAYKGINDIIEQKYPVIYAHLKQFEDKLRQRGQVEGKPEKPGSNQHHWTELDNNISIEKLDDFSMQKIAWNRIASEKVFALVDNGYFLQDSMHFITGNHLIYLSATLNSKLFRWLMYLIVGDAAGGNAGNAANVTELRIAQISSDLEGKIKRLYALGDFQNIDNIIYEIYDLSEKERNYVATRFSS